MVCGNRAQVRMLRRKNYDKKASLSFLIYDLLSVRSFRLLWLPMSVTCRKLNTRGPSIESKSFERERLESAAEGKFFDHAKKKGLVS